GVVGLAYGSNIMALRGLDDNGSGTLLGLLSAVTYAAENGARVINNSWGGSFRSAWGDAVIDYARSLGALVVSAAGNEALQTCSNFPANSENSMAVGAVEPFDVLAYYSNYGVKTDVVAPGGDSFGPPNDILSTLSPGSLLSSGSVVPGGCGSYLYLAGTSMAAPHVSALGALIWQVHPTWNAEEVKQRIRKSVLPLGQAGANGFDSTHGYGRIDAPLAVAPGAPPPIASVSSPANCTTLVAGTGSAPVNVLGEAGGSGFVGYRVDIAPGIDPAPSDFSALGGGTSPVPVGGVLWSNLHQISLANGTYTLRVVTSNNVGVLSEDRNEIAFRSAYISSPTNDALIRVPSLSILGNVPSSLLRMSSGAWVPDPLVKYTLAWRKPTGSSVIFHTSLTGSTNVLGPWTTSAIAEGDTFVELKATYQSGVILQDEVRVVIDRLLRQGFPAVINESFTVKSPAVADLNNDGQKEIVYGASVFRADGSVFPGWDNSPGLGRSNPAIVDAVGNDGKLEIIAAVMSTYIGAQTNMPNCGGPVIYCYPWTGKSAPVWSFQPQNPAGTNVCNNIGVPSTISAADVDGDGKLDVVFTVNYPLQSPAHTTLFVLDAATGVLKAQRDILGYSISSVALANLDAAQDAAAELVMSQQSGGGNNTYVMKFS
ncbi:MAG: hypothetical protein FJ405_19085, partial [Verrucomicrobia bacterium]|nr:hypothetical protein [Verrucomicrobiota bacterium]